MNFLIILCTVRNEFFTNVYSLELSGMNTQVVLSTVSAVAHSNWTGTCPPRKVSKIVPKITFFLSIALTFSKIKAFAPPVTLPKIFSAAAALTI